MQGYACKNIIYFIKLAKHRNKLSQSLHQRYKLVVLHEETFEERASFSGKLWYWITGLLSATAILVIFTIILIRSTSLREYVIGSALSGYERSQLMNAYSRIDSLEQIALANDLYLNNLQTVISGSVGENDDSNQKLGTENVPSTEIPESKPVPPSEDELAMRQLVESGAPYDLPENSNPSRSGISSYTFYSPIKGIISSSFNAQEQHYAIDIAVKMNEPVRSTLSGHVVFASYTPETGYVAIVQHGNNLLSLYKHCASIIKKVGSFVRGGEVIAFAGDTGELTTGPHLHFELWYNGNPVNPTDYIAF